MKEYKQLELTGERALFNINDAVIDNCRFYDGESPLKESRNLRVINSTFEWKYPLWYCQDVKVNDSVFKETARSGIWYTNNITIENTIFDSPKMFRRCDNVSLSHIKLNNASETLWNSKNIKLKNVYAKGDYLAMNCENVEIDGLTLDGNYLLDGAKNIIVKNSRLISKDAFWNTSNVYVENCLIDGEYLAWNSRNIRFKNCIISSNQGLCYIDDLVLDDCKLLNTDLAFEYTTVNAKINSIIDSIKNPNGGIIEAQDIKELIFDEHIKTSRDKTKIIIKNRS